MIKDFLIFFLICFACSYGNPPLEDYFSYVKQLGQSSGNYLKGEIEIVSDPAEISKIQKIQEQRLLQKGFSSTQAIEFSRIGIVNEDPYWIWCATLSIFLKALQELMIASCGKVS